MIRRNILLWGILIAFFTFLVHLAVINDYPVSWDYHFHYYGGLHHLGLSVPAVNEPPPVPFSLPDPRVTVEDPFGPFLSIIPTLSQIIFHDRLNLLPFDSAYNLVSVLFGSAGVGLIFIFLAQEIGFTQGLTGALFLGLFPAYFGYTHTNMKDIPNAFAFALSIYFFWKLEKTGKIAHLVAAVLVFAFAFNYKINSVFVPVVCILWLIWINKKYIAKSFMGKLPLRLSGKGQVLLSYFLLAPLAAVALWWPFWKNPVAKLLEMPKFFAANTLGMPVLHFGRLFYSCYTIPLSYPYGSLLSVTPTVILLSFALGLWLVVKRSLRGNKFSSFLVLWFFVPLVRYLNPKVCAIDGVRHFIEVLYPYVAISAIGWVSIMKLIGRKFKGKYIGLMLTAVLVAGLGYNIVRFHPYQTSYYSMLVGGLKGALEKFDVDMWGTPQREAVYWLNKNAPADASINIVMAQASAALYLRPDLLAQLNKHDFRDSDYTVVLNRRSFLPENELGSYVSEKTAEGKAFYQKSIDEVPLVWVFKK